MNSEPQTLKETLIANIPPGFLSALHERISNIYPESYAAMFNDPGLGEEQASYVLGHYRRGRAETIFMHTAAEYGLEVKLRQPENGGCKHVYVKVGGFGFAMCHVSVSAGFPKHSDSREQSSKINELIGQTDMFPSAPTPDAKELYGIFVHTEMSRNKDAFKSFHIGFPNPDFDDWIEEPLDIQDIIDIQQRLFQSKEDPYSEIQDNNPTWKTNTDKKRKKGKQ